MSLIMRVAALVLFSAILAGERTPVQTQSCDEIVCEYIGGFPPRLWIQCWDLQCVFAHECETNCEILDCDQYEAGAILELWCAA
jgi:hypothetical protein